MSAVFLVFCLSSPGKETKVPLLTDPELLALGNPPDSQKQGVLCGVGRTIAFKRFRSTLLYTFLPSPWQQARRGESGYQATVTAVRITASCDFRFLYFLRRQQNILLERKACLGTVEESGNCFRIRVFLLSLFRPSKPLPPGCQLYLLLRRIYLPSIKVSLWSQMQQFSEQNRCISGV